jgi:replicative DNA helicase
MERAYPNSLEVETALLAGLMARPEAFLDITEDLSADDFSDQFYGAVWGLMADMIRDTGGISPVILAAKLTGFESDTFNPQAGLADLGASVVTTVGVPHYATLIAEAARLRRLHTVAAGAVGEIARASLGNGDAGRIGAQMVSTSLEASASKAELLDFDALGKRVLGRLTEDLPTTSTGFPRLDDALGGGLYPGRLYGLSAMKKAGKTTMLGTFAYNMTERNESWMYCALEMGADQIYERLLARRMGVNSSRFLDRESRQSESFVTKVREATTWFEQRHSVFRSHPGMTLENLLALLARVALSGRYKGCFIDYLQLIQGKPSAISDTYWLDVVAQSLAEAAKKYGIWIVVAAQIGRQGTVYGGDGLGRACDVNLKLARVERVEGDPRDMPHRAWLEMLDSRYTPIGDVGSESLPAYILDASAGPHFEEMPRSSSRATVNREPAQ